MNNIDNNLPFLEEPANRENYQQLRDLLFEERMVAFVGAGCSVPLDYPTWSSLIGKMMERCVVRQPDRENYWRGLIGQLENCNINLLSLADQCKTVLGTDYFELLEREFDKKSEPNCTSEHECLINLPFHRFITSNYDECIEAAFIRVNVSMPKTFSYNDERMAKFAQHNDETRNFIFHCHGKHHPSREIILTESDYQIHYFRRPEYTQMLNALFQNNPVLFIGFSLSDADFGQIPRQLSALFENRAQKHFALLPAPAAELEEFTREDLRNRFNVHVIFYPVGANNDHSARERILRKLLSEQQTVPQPGLDYLPSSKEVTVLVTGEVRSMSYVEINILMLEYRFELSGPVWKTRILEYQRKAMKHEPAYVEPQPGPIRYVPTDEGERLLPPDLREKIINMLEEDSSMENNILLLTLSISNLLKIAQGKQVELDVLLGVIASFADKIRGQIK